MSFLHTSCSLASRLFFMVVVWVPALMALNKGQGFNSQGEASLSTFGFPRCPQVASLYRGVAVLIVVNEGYQ